MRNKKERTLKDFDNLPLSKIDGFIVDNSPMPNIDNNKMICPTCGSENKLELVVPEKIMENKKLYECSICHERCYSQ